MLDVFIGLLLTLRGLMQRIQTC